MICFDPVLEARRRKVLDPFGLAVASYLVTNTSWLQSSKTDVRGPFWDPLKLIVQPIKRFELNIA